MIHGRVSLPNFEFFYPRTRGRSVVSRLAICAAPVTARVVAVVTYLPEPVGDAIATGLVGTAVGTAAIAVQDIAIVANLACLDDAISTVIQDARVLTGGAPRSGRAGSPRRTEHAFGSE